MEALDQMLADTLVFVYIVFVTAKLEGTTPGYKKSWARGRLRISRDIKERCHAKFLEGHLTELGLLIRDLVA